MAPPVAPVILSAYNASTPDLATRPEAEAAWYRALREGPEVDGLELTTVGATLHPAGSAHLAALLDPAWRNIVGGMGRTLERLAVDPDYGLASRSPAARAAAVADVAALRDHVRELRAVLGEHAVRALVLHSAPRATRGSAEALEASLREIVALDWGPMSFLIEHTDAIIDGHPPQKGWQPVDVEIAVLRRVREQTGADARLLMNWGRAAIETRSAAGATELTARVGRSGVLGAIALSGASGDDAARGGPWADVHLGMAPDDPLSLLDPTVVAEAIALLPGDALFLGVKVGPPPGAGLEAEDRLRFARSVQGAARLVGAGS